MDRIGIFIVEDDPFWMKLIKKLINEQSDMFVIGSASSKEEVVNLIKTLEVDIIVMDINLSGNIYDGIEATLKITQNKSIKVIMLTSYEDEDIIRDSFIAGAVNFISKRRYKELPDAIRLTFSNSSPIEVVLREFSRLKREEQLKDLSPAEREVFELIEQGYSHAEMANTLLKAESTIKKQITKILKKLGVRTSREAVMKVKSKGLIKNSFSGKSMD
ncbi:DNA-binding response regulator [Vulcanibacillus modesticaldus]|uniref:DNA-binding response regulator n=1 Tax=Vulcanibacillus modesticaldus TaxID=337097 RepID=A0A1D2YV12_9BACI|nr:response regulator transcription factor [Vulcanibacillus modesticaldus]OEF99548.1 DNA-binding response regulator [Vulcanibacillus modesticaldus]